jgi:hypothetical protein
MVGAAVAVGLVVGLTVAIPTDVPSVALQASPVYRLEVGGAIFVGLYLAAMAFVLALRNHGFTEFGTGGVRAQDLGDLPAKLRSHENALKVLSKVVGEMKDLRDEREEEGHEQSR